MTASVIVFPGSNCDRDVAVVLKSVTGKSPKMVWHQENILPKCDLIVIPGGFSYGDYLRSGAMAAHSPIMKSIVKKARSGVPVLGICNGFQILTETGLLPGVLMRNSSLRFVCKDVNIRVEKTNTIFSKKYNQGEILRIPIAHHDGNYFTDEETLKKIEDGAQIAFRYCDEKGDISQSSNPNGSVDNIAGIFNSDGNILGMMPHPERLADSFLGGTDGLPLFSALAEAIIR